jgi:hypothetical protein
MPENGSHASGREIPPDGKESPGAAEEAPGPGRGASPAAPVPAGRPGGSGGSGRSSESGKAGKHGKPSRWELTIAAAIALVAVTGAVLTYLSIQQESAAVEADRQSVVETMLVQNQRVSAETQARAYGELAARYRQLMAEAGALAATDPDQASLLRQDAAGFLLPGVTQYLTGAGATAQYNFPAALQGALTVSETTSIPPSQPGRTAQLADRHRQMSGHIALCAVGLLGVVVLLTLARLQTPERRKRAVFGAAVIGYAVAVIAAIAQFA